ncbi:hypothetical protein [Thalassotalea ganghwensis]
MNQPYSIEHKRDLNNIEVKLLQYLLSNSGLDEYLKSIAKLKVIARCGCGKCPTVMFGESFDSNPIENSYDLTKYVGTANNGTKVGVSLMGTDSQLTELEAWSCCGGKFDSWPDIDTLECIDT